MARFAAVALTILMGFSCSESAGDSRTSPANRQADSAWRFSRVAQVSSPCNEVTARNVGKLYYTLMPINEVTRPREVEAFVRDNSHLLTANGPTIQCARLVGTRLVQGGLASFSSRDRDRAYGSALSMGATGDQARAVADSVNSGSLDAYMMGQELLWFAEVLPAAARGNWGPFNSTGSQGRQMIRQVWPMYQSMMAMDPSMQATLQQALGAVQPWAEYQVAVLAYSLGR